MEGRTVVQHHEHLSRRKFAARFRSRAPMWRPKRLFSSKFIPERMLVDILSVPLVSNTFDGMAGKLPDRRRDDASSFFRFTSSPRATRRNTSSSVVMLRAQEEPTKEKNRNVSSKCRQQKNVTRNSCQQSLLTLHHSSRWHLFPLVRQDPETWVQTQRQLQLAIGN